jgi:hypothetical protein
MNILYRIGGLPEPCATPTCIILFVYILPSTGAENFIFERKELMSLIKLAERFNYDNLHSNALCRVVSKVFSTTKYTATIMIVLKLRVTWSVRLRHCNVVL